MRKHTNCHIHLSQCQISYNNICMKCIISDMLKKKSNIKNYRRIPAYTNQYLTKCL